VSDSEHYRISDGGGLYIEVNPKGGKAWRQTYRLNGKPRAHPHGLFPAVKLGQARLLREQLKEQVRNGEDPRRARAEPEAPAASPRDDDRM